MYRYDEWATIDADGCKENRATWKKQKTSENTRRVHEQRKTRVKASRRPVNSWVGKKTGKDGKACRQHGENWKHLDVDTTILKARKKKHKFLIHILLKLYMPNQTK